MDHLNTVRDIAQCDPHTGATTVVTHLVYDAFGRVTAETNPAVGSLFLFTARPFDEDTHLQNNLNRWYDARVGRWLSEDPVLTGPNPYAYAGANPLTRTDAPGLSYVGSCINACIAGCDREFGWYNPQRYICRSYCDNTCTGTPDIWDRLSGLLAAACGRANRFANMNVVMCGCGVIGIADLGSSGWPIEALDCACNLVTTVQTACNRGLRGAALMAALTALDCPATAFAALGCEIGAAIGGTVGNLPGALIGCFVGKKFGDTLINVAAWVVQNYDQQGKPWPAGQAKACCKAAGGNWW